MNPTPAPLHLRVPGLPDWIEPTVDYLVTRARQSNSVAPDRARRLLTALHEALTNAVVHGNLGISSELKERGDDSFLQAMSARCADPAFAGRVVEIRVSHDDEFARWTITDEGDGFDADAVMGRLDQQEPDVSLASGRGLMLIRAFTDQMRYEDRGRRLVLGMRRPATEEKRAEARRGVSRGVEVAPLGPGGEVDWSAAHPALLRNLSSQGAALLQAEYAPSGRVLITIPTPSGEPLAVFAEVRHWHELGDSVVEVGCRFERPVPLAALGVECADDASGAAVATLVQSLAERQRPPSERRSAPRVAYTEAILVEAEGQPPARAFARDLSRGGISFFTTASVPPGGITLSLPAGDSCIRLRAQVVRCTRLIEGFHEVAARFVPS